MKILKWKLLKTYLNVKKVVNVQGAIREMDVSQLVPFDCDDVMKFELGLPGISDDDVHVSISGKTLVVEFSHFPYYQDMGYVYYWSVKKQKAVFDLSDYEDVDLSHQEVRFDRGMLVISFIKTQRKNMWKKMKIKTW